MRTIRRPGILGWFPILMLLVGASVLGAIRENGIATEVEWSPAVSAGFRTAKASGRPILLSFTASGDLWCRKMEAETFADPRVVELSREFVCLRANNDTGPDALRRYAVTSWPTTIVADSCGVPLAVLKGYVAPAVLAPLLRRCAP